MAKMKHLLGLVDDLGRSEENKFTDFDLDDIKAFSVSAVLVEWKGEEHWLPFSQLRKDERDQVLASHWILETEGIEV